MSCDHLIPGDAFSTAISRDGNGGYRCGFCKAEFVPASRLDVAEKEIGRVNEVRDSWYESARQLKERAIKAESRLSSIANIAGGDWRMNSEHSMEQIYATATGQPMPLPRKPCPDCKDGMYRQRGRGGIVIPCGTCGGSGRVVEKLEIK